MSAWRAVEHVLVAAARIAWPILQSLNRRFPATPFQPRWAPGPLLKSSQRTRPVLGWPRSTDSLCPECVKVTRRRILSGEQSIDSLVHDHSGEIRAHILERDGKVVIEKTCPTHGAFTDTLAVDPAFLTRIESCFPAATSKRSPPGSTITGRRPFNMAGARCSRSTSPTAAT